MSIQFKRGTTLQHSTYIGSVGEVTYDTDKDALVVHDGVTAGGWPQVGLSEADARYGSSFLSVDGTVAANALTAMLQPCKLDFRSAVLTTGTPRNRTVPAAISLVVPAGATLGTVAAQPARLVLLAIDNAGTVELAITNQSGGLNLDETTLISTTAISAAATSANVIYSTISRASVPFRVVGFIDATEAAAGTWATAPATVQGVGGQALVSLSSLGFGQKWQAFTSAVRAIGTTYYNTTGKPIAVFISVSGAYVAAIITVNGIVAAMSRDNTAGANSGATAIVPPGASYVGTGGTWSAWNELR